MVSANFSKLVSWGGTLSLELCWVWWLGLLELSPSWFRCHNQSWRQVTVTSLPTGKLRFKEGNVPLPRVTLSCSDGVGTENMGFNVCAFAIIQSCFHDWWKEKPETLVWPFPALLSGCSLFLRHVDCDLYSWMLYYSTGFSCTERWIRDIVRPWSSLLKEKNVKWLLIVWHGSRECVSIHSFRN